jgi:hypothetical protein
MSINLANYGGGSIELGNYAYVAPAVIDFNFIDSYGNPLSTVVESNISNVTGPAGTYTVSLSGDPSLEVSIDGGAYTSTPSDFTIPTNTTIRARLTSSGSYSTAVTGTVTIDTVGESFAVGTIRDPAAVGGFVGGMSIGLGVGLTKLKYNAIAGGPVGSEWLDGEAWNDGDPWND